MDNNITIEKIESLNQQFSNISIEKGCQIILNNKDFQALRWIVTEYYSFNYLLTFEKQRSVVSDYIRDHIDQCVSYFEELEKMEPDILSAFPILQKPLCLVNRNRRDPEIERLYESIRKRKPLYVWGDSSQKKELVVDSVKDVILMDRAFRDAERFCLSNRQDNKNVMRYTLGSKIVESYMKNEQKYCDRTDELMLMISCGSQSKVEFIDIIHDASISGKIVVLDGIEKMDNPNDELFPLKSVFTALDDRCINRYFLVKNSDPDPYFPHKGQVKLADGFGVIIIDNDEIVHELDIGLLNVFACVRLVSGKTDQW